MSCQEGKDSPTTREPRYGPVSGLAEGSLGLSQAAIPSPSPSTVLLPAARTSLPSAHRGWRSPRCAAPQEPEEHLEPPLPLPSPGPRTTHSRAPPHASGSPAAPSPAPGAPRPPSRARSSDGPGRGPSRGAELQPPAFGAAGGRTHSSPSPRVNSSLARSAPRPHPPAAAPRRPARRRRRPYLVGEFEHCHSSAPWRAHTYRSPARRCHARSRGSGRDCQGKGKKIWLPNLTALPLLLLCRLLLLPPRG